MTPVRPIVQDARTGKFLFDIPLPPGVKSSWHMLAAAPDNRTFVLSGWTGPNSPFRYFRIHLDEEGRPGAPELIPGFETDDLNFGYGIALSPDGTRLACASMLAGGVNVSVIELRTGHRRDWSTAQPDMVSGLAWAPNGHDLALALSKGGLRILDVSQPTSELLGATRLVRAVEGFWPLGSVAYAPDGRTLVYAVRSAIERIPVDGEGPPQVLAQLERPRTASLTVVFSLDGTGRHLLYVEGWRSFRLDLVSGRVTSLPILVGEHQRKGGSLRAAW
jgi:WD40 repeat protein